MPGLREKYPTSPSPELRRIRASLLTTSSILATTRIQAPRAKALAKEEEERRQNGNSKEEGGGSASSARLKSPLPIGQEMGKTRCSWITSHSEPIYVSFHDEEWGVLVHDDRKLFELLTLSQALAELSWPTILGKREELREMFDGFDYASVAEFTEKKINLLRSSASIALSGQKIRAIVTNAKQIQKVITEFGSFSNYCWSFVNHRPITNSFRYARQVPIKTPKSEALSKDLMRRGFQCVGPTTIYSFMQVTGIVNGHLSCCFRFQACSRHRADEKSLGAKPALTERSVSSSSSEGSEIRQV